MIGESAGIEEQMRSKRIERFADAKARLDDKITRWLEHNDPDAFFGHVSHRKRMERILEMTRDIQGRIVDIGPFAGVLSQRIIAQGGKEIYGIDSHEAALRLAARRGVLPVLADIEEEGVGSEDNSFDAAIMGDVLGYVLDPDFVIGDIYRALKPGAKFILSVPNLASLGNRILMSLGHVPYDMDVRPYGGGYQRYYTFATLRELLTKHGFEIVSMEASYVHLPLYRLPVLWRLFKSGDGQKRWMYWHWLAKVAPKLGEHVLVLARKPGTYQPPTSKPAVEKAERGEVEIEVTAKAREKTRV